MKSILITLIALFSNHQATSAAIQPPDFNIVVNAESVELVPPLNHHFNIKASNKIEWEGSPLKIKAYESRITAKLPLKHAEGTLVASAFICDNAKSYCAKKVQSIKVPGNADRNSAKSSSRFRALKPSKPYLDLATGFLVNDPKKALKLAAQKKKPLIIDFFGIWCPPCNHIDAMVFQSPGFKKRAETGFVRLKMDADHDASAAMKKKYKIVALPTVVFTTADGDEITRFVGYRPLDEVLRTLDFVTANKDEGYASLASKADGPNPEAKYKAALIALDRGDAPKAIKWLEPLRALFEESQDPRLETLFRAEYQASLANSDSVLTRKVLHQWISKFPDSKSHLESYQHLADLEENQGNVDAAKDHLRKAVQTAERMLKLPLSELSKGDYTIADLHQTLAELYSKMGEKEQAKMTYLKCAQAYQDQALEEGSEFARGPSLEKAYCLSKAGKTQESEAIYVEGIKRFPNEYTFHSEYAKLLLDLSRTREAFQEINQALQFAYGGQRLKATMVKSKILEGLGDIKASIQAIDDELKTPLTQNPSLSALKLRQRLEARRDELKKKQPKDPN